MIADDLFAGAGGWDLAAAQLGIHARGVENMKEARATRDAASLTTIHDDVWTFEPDGKASGLIASPPCQTFSTAGKGSGRKALDDVLGGIWTEAFQSRQKLIDLGWKVNDPRTALVLTPLHFATQYDYEWLAWEQVPAVLPVWEACAEVLEEHGWYAWTGCLHAEQYGVPQTRKRAFLLASRTGPVAPPEPTHSRYYGRDPGKLDLGVKQWISMAEALGWGLQERPSPTITGGGVETGGAEPIAKWDRYTTRPDFLRPNKLPNATVRSVDSPAPTITGGHDYNDRCWSWDAPIPVDSPRRPERVSVAEAAVLQSFPANYPWQGFQGKQYLQVGNAVPPGMAGATLRAVLDARYGHVAAPVGKSTPWWAEEPA